MRTLSPTAQAAIVKAQKDEGEIRLAVLTLVRDDPEVINQVERSEKLMDVLASRPELEEQIVAMAEEVGSG